MLNTDNTFVLIVDIQERLLPALNGAQDFAAACRKFITGANLLGLPLAVTEQYPKGLGATVADIRLLVPEAPVSAKTRFSAYTDEIAQILKNRQPENIILIGCETHICMLQTAQDLLAAGFAVFVPQECVASRTAENKANGLQQIREAGGTVSNIESLLFMLLKDAAHPQFKAVSKLIV